MAGPDLKLNRLRLPARVRTLQSPDNNIPVRLALADRIADLPGIQAADHDPADDWKNVDVLLLPRVTARRKQRQPLLLCNIRADGIVVQGLINRHRHQVLSRGWGRLRENSVLLYLPRDEEELEIVWSILRCAYDSVMVVSAGASPVRAAWFDGLPSFSRTNLQ